MTDQHLGRRAIVIGAGIGGIGAAAAMAPFFEEVLILERDQLPDGATPRSGLPQGKHLHGLLGGGLDALSTLLPGLIDNLAAAGAVRIRMSADFCSEIAGREKHRIDLGWTGYAQSRPLLERVMQKSLESYPNVFILCGHRVLAIDATPDGKQVTGIRYALADGSVETAAADLVVDASGRGAPTVGLLQALTLPRPKEVHIGIDLGYSSAFFTIPDDAPKDWLAAVTHADPGKGGRAAAVNAIEDNLWIVTLCGRGDDQPPADPAGFMGFARSLSTQTIFDVIKTGEMVGGISRFGIPGSVRRSFDLATMPEHLVVLGDALCRFNPIYGQGMATAACEALRLREVLVATRDRRETLSGVGPQFQIEAQGMLDGPWQMSAIPDFVHPSTRGERPENFEQILAYNVALQRLVITDPAVDRLVTRVWHLMEPASALQDPALVQRVQAEMAAASAA